MSQTIGYITLVVRDYDEAIAFFTRSLGFDLIEDTPSKDRRGREKRWVLVAPRGSGGTALLLAKASTNEEAASIGNQTGGRVFLFLHTDELLAGLPSDERKRREVRQGAKGRRIRNSSSLRRSLRQQVGFVEAERLLRIAAKFEAKR